MAIPPGEGHIVADDGVGLFARRAGEGGQPLVILNGFYLFDDFAGLADRRAVVSLDLRNRGRSGWISDPSKLGRGVLQDVDDIEMTRRHFGIERIDLLAHSYACLVAILYAMRHPTRVGRMVLLGPMPPDADAVYPEDETNHDDVLRDFAKAAGALQKRRQELPPRELCREFWKLLRGLYLFDPRHAEKLRSWERCDLDTELNFMRYWLGTLLPSIQELSFPPTDLARVSMPVLIVHGTKDRSAPYGGGSHWARLLPDARLMAVENAAHAPWIEAPEEVHGAIRTFFDGAWPRHIRTPEGT